MVKSVLFCFNCQTCFESSVSFEYFFVCERFDIYLIYLIVDFYPSISENLLDQALSWASNLADISDEDISIIKHI